MALVETLVLTVGPAVSKAVLKRWVHDDATIAGASSIIDILKDKTSDVLAQQRVKRQLEAIGEHVAENLRPVFGREGSDLDEGSHIAVARALASTLTLVSSDIIVENDLLPRTLAARLLSDSPPETRLFSAAELTLFERLVIETSQYIIDIASGLPNFSERAFSEILKRENHLIDAADRILEEVKRIREASDQANIANGAKQFEEDYRREVVRVLDRLELFGADLSEASRRHRLSVAYVSLSVKHSQLAAKPEDNKSVDNNNVVGNNVDGAIVPAHEAFADSRCLLVRGPAGSGKTTLLQWIAVRSASRTFEGDLVDWNDSVPFYIRLREFSHLALPRPEEFPACITSSIAATMPNLWAHHRLRSGRAIVLIDGIDEIPETRRNDVRTWIDGLVANFPKSRFVVTARPYSVGERWMDQQGFDDAELQPMELADIHYFIEHWHNAVREALEDERDRSEISLLSERLISSVMEQRPLRNLATSPLLCAMLCALHRDRREEIPTDRVALYEACCDTLINRRDLERRIKLDDYPVLTSRQKRGLLEDLSYWMLRNRYSIVSIEDAKVRLAPRVVNLQNVGGEASVDRVLSLLVDRTGILREPVKGQADFAHKTFQEFLAAQAILDEGDLGVLIEHALDDQWREVILLAVGLAKGRVGERIIEGLIDAGLRDSKSRQSFHLLAVACVGAASELSPVIKTKVREYIAELVPPKNFAEAAALAAAGELAIPFLCGYASQKAEVVASCIRSLSLIGGDDALIALEAYAGDTRFVVKNELQRSWDSFDRVEFAKHMMKGKTSFKPRRFSILLKAAEYLPDVTELDLTDCTEISDIGVLAKMPQLTNLNLSAARIDKRGQTKGRRRRHIFVRVGREHLIDLTPLSALVHLKVLELEHCSEIQDLGPLAGMTNLQRLSLHSCRQITSLEPLGKLTNLSDLNLAECTGICDLTPLAGITSLITLNLYGCSGVLDVSPLQHLKQLDQVWGIPNTVDTTQIEHISKLGADTRSIRILRTT